MAQPKKRLGDRLDDAPGFIVSNAFGADLGTLIDETFKPVKSRDPRKPTSNEQSVEAGASLIPILVTAVTDILTIGAIAPHRPAIRRHLSDRALDAAISKLQSVRRD